ncbi:unnamed protein product [Rotaria socialis]|uniref:Uncharacterized protein n=1 Tax=Rotaria socialis TaxID=392032 RepID=A0A818VCI0_9BILA|nr:unnamed protein product [Rotaria socialis]
MFLFPSLYSSLMNFELKGGHRRRSILIQVKQKKYECMAQLSASQIMLAGCNNMVQPVLFANILNITCALSMELGKITQELNQLEYIHVVILHGTLPY